MRKNTSNTGNRRPGRQRRRHDCWRDWYSSQPRWDFYRNATRNADQLRQRTAYALQQILVVNNLDVEGTYGLRNYHNALPTTPSANFLQLLRKVTVSPVMGDFLNNANNDKAAPSENYARELLQLILDRHRLNPDGRSGRRLRRHLQQRHGAQLRLRADRLDHPAGGAAPAAGRAARTASSTAATWRRWRASIGERGRCSQA